MQYSSKKNRVSFLLLLTVSFLCGAVTSPVYASSAGDSDTSNTAAQIQQQIDDHNAQIQKLDSEISQYQQQLSATQGKKKTLQNSLNQITISIKKTTTTIQATQQKISATSLEIDQLGTSISDKQKAIETEQAGLAQSIRSLAQNDTVSFAESALSSQQLSDVWRDTDQVSSLHTAITNHTQQLLSVKTQLTALQNQATNKKQDLVSQKNDLQVQQGSLSAAQDAQSSLLAQTKKQESTYQQIIAQKKQQEQSFEDALIDLQSKLQIAVKSSDITKSGAGVLQWPVSPVIITQFFGNTQFASTGAYNGKGHNGVDIGVPIGTPVHAALSGVVFGTGNTDLAHGCYSFGKWVMIKHANGLNTMYAHLSSIQVTTGQSVATGDLLGYSGETGYATGPHLHFGVYVSAVTQIMKLGDATKLSTPCAGVSMPVPPLAGYLNPMNYLPSSGYTVDD